MPHFSGIAPLPSLQIAGASGKGGKHIFLLHGIDFSKIDLRRLGRQESSFADGTRKQENNAVHEGGHSVFTEGGLQSPLSQRTGGRPRRCCATQNSETPLRSPQKNDVTEKYFQKRL